MEIYVAKSSKKGYNIIYLCYQGVWNFIMKNLIITGRNLTKSYDGIHNILSDVNIEIEAGSKNLIIGESGCGKTTLLSILEGIEQPDSGVLILKDCDMYGMKLQQWLKEWI